MFFCFTEGARTDLAAATFLLGLQTQVFTMKLHVWSNPEPLVPFSWRERALLCSGMFEVKEFVMWLWTLLTVVQETDTITHSPP